MQDKFVGDIGDFVKYGLLRALMPGMKLGVAWYLNPQVSDTNDGCHTEYLKQPHVWRSLDPELFDRLAYIVDLNLRSVAEIEDSDLLGDARFASEKIVAGATAGRQRWFGRVLDKLHGCDLVFADPDNGLYEDDKFWRGGPQRWKLSIPLDEAIRLAEGRTAIIYHHNTRFHKSEFESGHEAEVRHWQKQLGEGTMALRWREYGARTFFVTNPTVDITKRLKEFEADWMDRGQQGLWNMEP